MGFCFKPLNAKDTCTTITARYFKCGASDPYIKEPKIVASRGRNPNNTSDRTPGNYVEQRLEVNENGTSNALTTVQKDNYVLEPRIFEHRTDGIRFFSDNCCGALRTKSECGDKRVIEDCHAIRKLTPRECLRLQDFSDDFKIVVSDSQMYKQAGNSMSVNVLEMIFKQIELAKSGETTNTLLDFVS
jgi:site-specific DNA-cytosine methylase